MQPFMKKFLTAVLLIGISLAGMAGCSKDSDKDSPSTAGGLEGIYFISRTGYNWGGMFSYFEPFALFKDGGVRRHLKAPVETLNIASDKKEHPGDWGKWQKQGGNIVVQWANDNETWEDWYVSFPANSGEKLSGTYTSFFALANSGRGEKYTFAANGSFSMKRQIASGNETISGTYELKGYGIYFTYSNGTKESWSFCFYPKNGQKNTEAFLMAEDNFTRD